MGTRTRKGLELCVQRPVLHRGYRLEIRRWERENWRVERGGVEGWNGWRSGERRSWEGEGKTCVMRVERGEGGEKSGRSWNALRGDPFSSQFSFSFLPISFQFYPTSVSSLLRGHGRMSSML